MTYRLFEKTELFISPLRLAGADLGSCAQAAARALALRPEDIMVTDAIGDRLVLDILVPAVEPKQILAKKKPLLSALAAIPGVHITDETDVHSDGILGLISLDEKAGRQLLQRSDTIRSQVAGYLRKRAMIFATGQEVLSGQIRDANTPFLAEALKGEGYQVATGPVLKDRADMIAGAFCRAVEEGYGILISTGGIGAEQKDQTLEALARVDRHAVMPYILKFQIGQGRHHKNGVRIGVGVLEQSLIVCLPGPHDEVRLAWPVLKEGIKNNTDKNMLAMNLAGALRNKFIARSAEHHCHLHDSKTVCHR
ncbi:MAG: molybdopterin-binding protein [Thermodesulfobacteriota bacterium]